MYSKDNTIRIVVRLHLSSFKWEFEGIMFQCTAIISIFSFATCATHLLLNGMDFLWYSYNNVFAHMRDSDKDRLVISDIYLKLFWLLSSVRFWIINTSLVVAMPSYISPSKTFHFKYWCGKEKENETFVHAHQWVIRWKRDISYWTLQNCYYCTSGQARTPISPQR